MANLDTMQFKSYTLNMHGIKRTAVDSICELLKRFPCVAILGARQVGKTTILKQVLPNARLFDLENRNDFQRIQSDPDFFLSQQKEPIAIDEAQLLPEFFSALRVAIDADRTTNGRFLISGSSSPELLKHITETLAGRIALFELNGFSLEEQ
jgi:predicted AAA+ superfamily ATPase